MKCVVDIVVPGDEHWGIAKYIKANTALWRKLTRTKYGSGRIFSHAGFEKDVLKGALPTFFYLCKNALPQKKLKGRAPVSDKIFIYPSDEAKTISIKAYKHLRPGSEIQFCTNLAQFQMEIFRFMFKFLDHEDVHRFTRAYSKADIQTTQDFIDFLQAHVDKYHVEDSE